MTEFVVGFLMDDDDRVVLVRKNRPDWQRGLLNGVGGKVEPNELPIDAMRREFKEEADVDIEDWQNFVTIHGPDYKIHFYRYRGLKGQISLVKTMTDEEIEVHYYDDVLIPPSGMIENLYWILPLAVYSDNYYPISVITKGSLA